MPNNSRKLIKYSSAINLGINTMMKKNKKVIIIGLGVPDPKGLFGTTIGLQKKFGKKRVFDMPTSENGMTGIVLGSALVGLRPIITHQRVEFSLLSVEQIFNQAAKWNYMTNGKQNLPIVIRLIVGRGWGQGPQHSQSLEAMFAHVPGLKVIAPSTPYDAKGLIISSIEDNNPIIVFEHRWLFNYEDYVPNNFYRIPIGKANIINKGEDITIVSFSYATVESYNAIKILKKFGISIDLIDLRTIRPLDYKIIYKSVKKTKRLIVVDNGFKSFSVSSEIISSVVENCFFDLLKPPIRIANKDMPIPSSRELSKYCYPTKYHIVKSSLKLLNLDKKIDYKDTKYSLDIPDQEFKGPF